MNVLYIIIYIKILYKYRCKFIGIFKEYLLSILYVFYFYYKLLSLIIFMIVDIIQ